MVFDVRVDAAAITIVLRGWNRIMTWRRRVVIEFDQVIHVDVAERGALEARIDHRAIGFGTHDGARRPNRRRVGTMLGRDVAGEQWWAVPRTDGRTELLVVDLRGHEFARAVLLVDRPHEVAAAIERERA